ncbi:MAG: hypothetical protein K0B81_07040 [Candidatus Cloacimonetes bacterium]|nr:hypothetical protein [Candidatus Cloacimonadota bacterium]
MGQQQILLIVLSVILVGIAIAVGITMFRAQARQSNLDAIIADLNNLGAIAYQHKLRPVSMGGGGGVYDASALPTPGMGFEAYFDTLPYDMQVNQNGYYVIGTVTDISVEIHGWNATYLHGRTITIDENGLMSITDLTASPGEPPEPPTN